MGKHGIHLHLMGPGILAHGRQPMAVTYLPNIRYGFND